MRTVCQLRRPVHYDVAQDVHGRLTTAVRANLRHVFDSFEPGAAPALRGRVLNVCVCVCVCVCVYLRASCVEQGVSHV